MSLLKTYIPGFPQRLPVPGSLPWFLSPLLHWKQRNSSTFPYLHRDVLDSLYKFTKVYEHFANPQLSSFFFFNFCWRIVCSRASLVAQMVKNPPAKAGDAGLFPGSRKCLGKGTAASSSNFAWRIPWTKEPGRLQTRLSNSHTHTRSCSTVLCWFLLCSKVNQLCVTHIPSFLDFLPIQVSTEHWVEVPVIHSQFSLVTYFMSHSCIHVNANLPIHLNPLPTSPLGVYMFVLYVCVSISAWQIPSFRPLF